MLDRIFDRWRRESRAALRRLAFGAAAAACAAIAALFLCGAGFIVVLERYGPIGACLAGAALFLVAAAALAATRGAIEARRRRAAAEAPPPAAPDPRLILLGVEIARAIGVKRLLPILAIGGAAFALASRAPAGRRGRPDATPFAAAQPASRDRP